MTGIDHTLLQDSMQQLEPALQCLVALRELASVEQDFQQSRQSNAGCYLDHSVALQPWQSAYGEFVTPPPAAGGTPWQAHATELSQILHPPQPASPRDITNRLVDYMDANGADLTIAVMSNLWSAGNAPTP